jgi:hypothetical protein
MPKILDGTTRDELRRVVNDPMATLSQRRSAQNILRRFFHDHEARMARKQARQALGEKPKAEDFASEAEFRVAREAYRDGLEKLTCERVLDDAASSLTQRRIAKQTLEEIEQRERKRGAEHPIAKRRDGPKAPTTPAAKPVELATTYSDPAVQRFLESLDGSETNVRELEPDLPEVAPAPAEKPIAVGGAATPELYCENCQVPFSVCHCDATEVCSLCLIPKGRCYCPRKK